MWTLKNIIKKRKNHLTYIKKGIDIQYIKIIMEEKIYY